MMTVWRIQLWLDYLEREDIARFGKQLCEALPEPGNAAELLDILKISRYKELGLSSRDLHRILRHITECLPFVEYSLPKQQSGKIFTISGCNNYLEFPTNLSAAKKCASHGYDVYMLPNPNEGKTPDFILVKKDRYYAYELKTIYKRRINLGKNVKRPATERPNFAGYGGYTVKSFIYRTFYEIVE